MSELKTLTLNGETFDSFQDKTARAELGKIPAVTGATVGQTVKIAAVDENGKPTAWEPVDWPGDEWELLTKNVETGEEEPIVMDAETLRYEFPSLSDYKKLIVIFNKSYKSTSGLSDNVWFSCGNNEARFIYKPSNSFNLLEINLSPIGMVMIHTFGSNNRQTLNNTINKTVLSIKSFSQTSFDLPNSDWAEYYASCNTKITVWGAR